MQAVRTHMGSNTCAARHQFLALTMHNPAIAFRQRNAKTLRSVSGRENFPACNNCLDCNRELRVKEMSYSNIGPVLIQ